MLKKKRKCVFKYSTIQRRGFHGSQAKWMSLRYDTLYIRGIYVSNVLFLLLLLLPVVVFGVLVHNPIEVCCQINRNGLEKY